MNGGEPEIAERPRAAASPGPGKGGRVNILCLKWGSYYSPEYVNRLHAGVKKNLNRPFRFVCVTDDPSGLAAGIDAVPFPGPPPGWKAGWPDIFIKLCVFKDGFAGLEGPTLFLDIDQIITGPLDRFFDYKPGEFCIIQNWIEWRKRLFRKRPKIGNSSCFRFEAGRMNHVYEKFLAEQDNALNRCLFRTEQAFMTYAVGLRSVNWWPKGWVASFKRSCTWPFPLNLALTPRPPRNASILCFHGNPTPQEAIDGFTGKKGHLEQRTRPAQWVKGLWTACHEEIPAAASDNTFLFVIWSKARRFEPQILDAISTRFKVLDSYEISWPARHFTENLASFYGWKNRFCWWNKARKCGRGPFLAVKVEDPAPKWEFGSDTSRHNLILNDNIRAMKRGLRALTRHSNRVHASMTCEETAHELSALASIGPDGRIPFKAMEFNDGLRRCHFFATTETTGPENAPAKKDAPITADQIDALLTSGTLERIGMGSRRACYRLPGTGLCVKCYRSDAEIEEGRHPGKPPVKPLRSAVVREIRRYRFNKRRNTCCQEYRYWMKLKKCIPANLMSAFPANMELVLLPSRGWAIVEEFVANADGTPVRKFLEEWQQMDNTSKTTLRTAYNALAAALVRHAVRFYDPQTIFVQRAAEGIFRLRITDFEPGSRLLVPIDAIPAITRLKVRRRFARYMQSYGLAMRGGNE